jgi:ATP-dependent protease HslVU (ClpYQ) peptidase subunit
MTIIAAFYKDEHNYGMASDAAAISGSTIVQGVQKTVTTPNGFFMGAAGSAHLCTAALQWAQGPGHDEPSEHGFLRQLFEVCAEHSREKDTKEGKVQLRVLMVSSKGLWTMHNGGIAHLDPKFTQYHAIGSGAPYALGAMTAAVGWYETAPNIPELLSLSIAASNKHCTTTQGHGPIHLHKESS